MTIRPIRNDEEYRAALKQVSPLFDDEPIPATVEGYAFEAMITRIEAYEAERFPLNLPD